MAENPIALYRYVLVQRFFDGARKIESHPTATLSLIGSAQPPELLSALRLLEYDEHRFRSPRCDAGGAWTLGSYQSNLPTDFSIICVSAMEASALTLLRAEVARYRENGVLPLIAWPGDADFAERITTCLVAQGGDWRFIYADVVSIVTAVLVPTYYPGLICVDSLDVRAVFTAGRSVRVVSFAAPTFNLLMTEIARLRCERVLGIFAALHGPATLTLNEVGVFLAAVRALGAGDFLFAGAALADHACQHYTLHVMLCE